MTEIPFVFHGVTLPRITTMTKVGYPFADHEIDDLCERGSDAIGSQDGENRSRTWFSHWFVCPYYNDYWWQPLADGVIWHRTYDKVTLNYPDGRKFLWMLTDQYDSLERRLGVWPD